MHACLYVEGDSMTSIHVGIENPLFFQLIVFEPMFGHILWIRNIFRSFD